MAGSGKTEPCASNESRLNAKASSDELAIRFHYDAQDALIGCSTSAGKEQRFYRNDELASEILGGASTAFVRAEGMVLAEHQAGSDPKSLLLAGDDKNSVLCEISQTAVKGVAYSPYGHRIDDALVSSHLGYNGERREGQTGWYLLGKGYRVFNPLLMRFHSPDNLSPFGEGGLNAYGYCEGEPINNLDPTGHTLWGNAARLGRRVFGIKKITTATPGLDPRFTEPTSIFALNPQSQKGPATLNPITREVARHLIDSKVYYRRLTEGLESINSPVTEKFKALARTAADDADYAIEHLHEIGITKFGAKEAKVVSKNFHEYIRKLKAAEKQLKATEKQRAIREKKALEKAEKQRQKYLYGKPAYSGYSGKFDSL